MSLQIKNESVHYNRSKENELCYLPSAVSTVRPALLGNGVRNRHGLKEGKKQSRGSEEHALAPFKMKVRYYLFGSQNLLSGVSNVRESVGHRLMDKDNETDHSNQLSAQLSVS